MGDHRFSGLRKDGRYDTCPLGTHGRGLRRGAQRGWARSCVTARNSEYTAASTSAHPARQATHTFTKTSLKLRIPRIKATLEVHSIFPGDF